jgi:hypothetical protein
MIRHTLLLGCSGHSRSVWVGIGHMCCLQVSFVCIVYEMFFVGTRCRYSGLILKSYDFLLQMRILQ